MFANRCMSKGRLCYWSCQHSGAGRWLSDNADNTEAELIEFYILFIFSLIALVLSERTFWWKMSLDSAPSNQRHFAIQAWSFLSNVLFLVLFKVRVGKKYDKSKNKLNLGQEILRRFSHFTNLLFDPLTASIFKYEKKSSIHHFVPIICL